ncbi:MAG: histidine--tRNA ligase, partial [Treponemataceae bacterium]|nr:histidine--tRNA ligase [Treponemataceae bacterium]
KYQIPGAKEKCALLYDDSIPFVQVMAEAEKLRESYSVSVLKKAKKPGPQFDMLEKQGYTKFAQFKDGAIAIK